MAYPFKTAEVFIGLGIKPEHFTATTDGAGGVLITNYISPIPQPTEAEVITELGNNPNGFANRLLLNDRVDLVAMLVGGPKHAKLMRALMLILLDEFNLHAIKINAILTAIDSGGTVAQIKTNILAITDFPQRTKANLITALTNKINAGDADA